MGILNILFFLCIFSFPFGEIARIQFGNGIAVTLNDVFVLATGLFYFLVSKKKEQLLALPFAIAIIVSLFVNLHNLTVQQFFVSSLYPLRYVLYLQLLFFVKNSNRKGKIIIWAFWAGFATILLGFLQYLKFRDIGKLFNLGWDNHMYRMFSTTLDPNFAGALFVLFFLFFLGLFFREKRKSNYLYLFTSLGAVIAVFLTYSRSAMVMLIISSFVLLSLLKKTKLILLLTLGILSFYVFTSRYFYVESINPFRIYSTEQRIKNI